MGASPVTILGVLVLEAALTAAVGAMLGLGLLYTGLFVAQPIIDSTFGLFLPIDPPDLQEGLALLGVIVAGAIVSLVPALRAYRLSLADGMMVRT